MSILRVSGIPEEVDEVTDDHIIKLANALDLPMTKQDIDRSRVGKPDSWGRVGRAGKSERQHHDIIAIHIKCR